MLDLVWHDFFTIGVNFIDNDHKKLLRIMSDIKQAVENANDKECVRLLTLLLREAKAHYDREETYLANVNYPQLDEHKIYHKELLEKVDTTKRICEGIETKHDLKECFDGMAKFLIDDILRGDINFKSYLEYEGYIERDA